MMPLSPHVPRGLRNNNPGNIRRVDGVIWRGQEATQTDPDFVQFLTPEYGIRAIARILHNYKREGLNTIKQAINKWAPPNENITSAYVEDVCQRCSYKPDDVVDFDAIMPQLVKAIIVHENAMQPYPDVQINKGISLAYD